MSAPPLKTPATLRPTQSDLEAFGCYGMHMSADDFLSLGQTRERYELVHGVVCMSPRPNTFHQRLLSLFIYQLEGFIRANRGFKYLPDVDLVLAGQTVYAPDIVCYRPGRVVGYPTRLETPPDLIIEILSYGTKGFDLTTKREGYEKSGVGEYWTYDPTDGEPKGKLRCARRASAADAFVDAPVTGDAFASTGVPGFVLDLTSLREAASGG